MSTEVKIPTLGESISSGILAKWHVADGDLVKKDQLLYELETDKITSEGHADAAGKITLKATEGDEVDIGAVVAEIDESAAANEPAEENTSDGQPATDSKREEKKSHRPDTESTSQSAPKNGDRPLSPAVRRIASESGIDPGSVDGSGKGGRVTKGDMLALANKKSADSSAQPKTGESEGGKQQHPASAGADDARVTRRKISPLRRKIAERLVAAQQGAALLTTFNEVDMSAVIGLRKRYQDEFVKRHGVKVGFMSFFIKAVVKALKDVPAINAQIEGDELVENHFYDIGVAVGTERGLVVPVIRDCDSLSFADIEKALAGYADKARKGKITIEDLTGGVFTISNGGIYGSMLSTPIVNPPQSGILGLHNIVERPVAIDGQVVIRPIMYLALSYDHRVVDGKEAVTFLVKVKQAIEDPTSLLLEI